MATHFLSVLGTSLYEPVIYETGEENPQEQDFIQLATIRKFYDDLSAPDSKISIFTTTSAETKNYKDRTYTEFEENIASKWATDRKEIVKKDAVKKGLETQFKEQFPELADAGKLQEISIPDGKTEGEIWGIFSAIFDEIREGDEIIFDITHSFRSIPMLAMTIINYAKVMKNCTLKGIYYGAYEAAPQNVLPKRAPIFNLTVYNDILDWTSAATVFTRYGNATMMKECFDQKYKSLSKDEKRDWSSINNIVEKAGILSDAIQTGRGADGNCLPGKGSKKAKQSIKSAYEAYAYSLKKINKSKAQEIEPLYQLLQHTEKEFRIFDQTENYEIGLAATQWAIQNQMVQQGFTSLEETIKTYLCWKYGLDQIDENDRDKLAGYCITSLTHAPDKQPLDTPSERMIYFEHVMAGKNASKYNFSEAPEKRLILQRMFADDNREMAKLAEQVKNARNDVNHFGMRKNPSNAEALSTNLKEYYNRLLEIINHVPED